MALVDDQIERLEDSLDGALSDGEMAALREQLAVNADLATAMEALAAQRKMRRKVWAALEPSDAEVERLLAGMKTAARQKAMAGVARVLRFAGAVAACIAISFLAGWRFHGKHVAGGGSGGNAQIVHPQTETAVTYQVALTDANGHVSAVQNFNSLEKAREFAADLQRWQQRQRQLRDGAAVLVSDRF